MDHDHHLSSATVNSTIPIAEFGRTPIMKITTSSGRLDEEEVRHDEGQDGSGNSAHETHNDNCNDESDHENTDSFDIHHRLGRTRDHRRGSLEDSAHSHECLTMMKTKRKRSEGRTKFEIESLYCELTELRQQNNALKEIWNQILQHSSSTAKIENSKQINHEHSVPDDYDIISNMNDGVMDSKANAMAYIQSLAQDLKVRDDTVQHQQQQEQVQQQNVHINIEMMNKCDIGCERSSFGNNNNAETTNITNNIDHHQQQDHIQQQQQEQEEVNEQENEMQIQYAFHY